MLIVLLTGGILVVGVVGFICFCLGVSNFLNMVANCRWWNPKDLSFYYRLKDSRKAQYSWARMFFGDEGAGRYMRNWDLTVDWWVPGKHWEQYGAYYQTNPHRGEDGKTVGFVPLCGMFSWDEAGSGYLRDYCEVSRRLYEMERYPTGLDWLAAGFWDKGYALLVKEGGQGYFEDCAIPSLISNILVERDKNNDWEKCGPFFEACVKEKDRLWEIYAEEQSQKGYLARPWEKRSNWKKPPSPLTRFYRDKEIAEKEAKEAGRPFHEFEFFREWESVNGHII